MFAICFPSVLHLKTSSNIRRHTVPNDSKEPQIRARRHILRFVHIVASIPKI